MHISHNFAAGSEDLPPREGPPAAGKPRKPHDDLVFQLQTVVYLPPHAGEKKYNSEIYEIFIDLFKTLPLCALIDNKYFAVHGGLSPAVKTLGKWEYIQAIYSDSIGRRKSRSKARYAICCGLTP